jgi:hypothetical protein
VTYWIFKANPDYYDIDGRLRDQRTEIFWWAPRFRSEMQPEDIVFIWRTGANRGICGAMRLSGCPEWFASDPDWPEDPYVRVERHSAGWYVVAEIWNRGPDISAETLRADPALRDLSVFHGFQQATNFRVSDVHGRALVEMLPGQAG